MGTICRINIFKRIKYLKNPIIFVDDYISGVYKNVNIRLMDCSTSVNFGCIMITFYFSIFIFGFLNIIGLILIIIALLIFLFKHTTSKKFQGLVVEIDMNKDFKGHTFVLEKNNLKNNLLVDRSKYELIKLEDIEFEKEFNIYSQDQIEARYILTSSFIKRLKKTKETFKAKYIRVSFKDKKIVILIHTGRDMFNVANFLSNIGKETFVQCFEEICSVLELIDTLKLNEKLGL